MSRSLVVVEKRQGLGVPIQRTGTGRYLGIASIGDEPDCVGDLIEGYEFEARVPFLIGHDTAMPAIGDAWPRVVGRKLYAEIGLAPEGTSVRVDEARRTIESGIGELSIGFSAPAGSRANEYGGRTYPVARVAEISLVGAGCSVGSGIGDGKRLACCAESCTCNTAGSSTTKTFTVDPAMVARLVADLTAKEVQRAINRARGSLDDGPPRREPRPYSTVTRTAETWTSAAPYLYAEDRPHVSLSDSPLLPEVMPGPSREKVLREQQAAVAATAAEMARRQAGR